MSDQLTTLGQRLKQTRQSQGHTQCSLATEVKTSQAVIQKIENGHSLRPRCLEVLATTLGVRCGWLQFGELPKTHAEYDTLYKLAYPMIIGMPTQPTKG